MERLKCTNDSQKELNLINFSATCFEFHEIEMFMVVQERVRHYENVKINF